MHHCSCSHQQVKPPLNIQAVLLYQPGGMIRDYREKWEEEYVHMRERVGVLFYFNMGLLLLGIFIKIVA